MATTEKKQKVKIDIHNYFDCSFTTIKVSDIHSVYTEDKWVIIQQAVRDEIQCIYHKFEFNIEFKFDLFKAVADIHNKINEARKKNYDDFIIIIRNRNETISYKGIYLLSEVEYVY